MAFYNVTKQHLITKHVLSNNNIPLRLILFYFQQHQGSKSMEHSIN